MFKAKSARSLAPHVVDASEEQLSLHLKTFIRNSSLLMEAYEAGRSLNLADYWLTSGAIYQSLWNSLTQRPEGYGLKDIDLIYFDEDRSWAAENHVIETIAAKTSHLPVEVEIKNQARVHLWFQEKFGSPYPKLKSATQSLLYYAALTHSVAFTVACDGSIKIAAPFGLRRIYAMRMEPNHTLDNHDTYKRKCARMARLWPELQCLPWD
ncbi:hypothetical protein E1162_10460 [Rhodobacteraceae bacterium RKSG542]|uniref:nucleotidyltransferase family protein n=1 Tax=Pseudovibrio flavus TaxID=2529854 RepID=UPI00211C2F84|nr:nucleotidyltransferase family protein [Pseudovibrio flavus]MTI17661.1 hypothetical protein [Pseudovibrio flavus]